LHEHPHARTPVRLQSHTGQIAIRISSREDCIQNPQTGRTKPAGQIKKTLHYCAGQARIRPQHNCPIDQ